MQTVKIGTYNKDGKLTGMHKVDATSRPTQPFISRQNQSTPKKKRFFTRGKIILTVLGILAIGILGFVGYRWKLLQNRVQNSGGGSGVAATCSDILDPACWTEAFRPQLKQTDGYTNALIVGLDTRVNECTKNSSLKNTDTIMVARLNHATGQTMLISIPRDFWVTFKVKNEEKGTTAGPFSMKITSVYATGEVREDVDDGMELLEQVVEEMIGEPIHYRAVVSFAAVEGVVETFDGVDVNIEEEFVAKYPNDCPTAQNPSQWLRYEFPEGVNHLDGELALVYARFRHTYEGSPLLASDFSRGERQQEVITALKEKAFSEELSVKDRAAKYWDILQTLNKNIDVNVTFEDMLAGLYIINEVDKDPINIVLDPNFGGAGKLIYHPPTDSDRGYVIEARDKTYGDIQKEMESLWQYGALYNEQAHLLISNRTGVAYPSGDKATELKNSDAPLGTLTYLTEKKTDQTGIRIYDFSNGKNPETINFLKQYFGTDKVFTDPATYSITLSQYKEDIKVVIGPPEPVETPATQ